MMTVKQRSITATVVKYIIFAVLYVILLFPFAYMLMKSLMTVADANASVVKFFPSVITFENYAVFAEYAGYFFNSLVVVAIFA